MSAPTLDASRLRDLKDDWDSYGAVPITEAALTTAQNLAAVPSCDGGIDLELHAGGYDIEVEIGPDGRITGLLIKATP